MNFFVCFVILAAAIVLSESSPLDSLQGNITEDRIIGGETAIRGQFPYIVSIRLVRDNAHRCGGSILSDRWVVTAAFCTSEQISTPNNVLIVVGAHRILNDGQTSRVVRIVPHPGYNQSTRKNDICLLQTTRPIQTNERVRAIPIATHFVGGSVASIVSGWGLIRTTGENQRPTHLQFLRVNTHTNEDCRARHAANMQRFITTTICAFAREGQGTCTRDDGSPLTANGLLIGIASWREECALGRPDGYTRVSLFVNWIRQVTGIRAV